MAWLARLDTQARSWPRVIRWSYQIVKWLLLAVGAWCVVGLALEEWHTGQPALGFGIAVASLLALTKGVLIVIRSRQSSGMRPPH